MMIKTRIPALARLSTLAADLKEPYGRGLDSSKVLPEITEALTRLLGPFKKQVFKTLRTKFTTTVLAGKPNLGRKVYALMNEFDFTPTRNDMTGHYGGYRPESARVSTTVNYCAKSGVLVITTNLDVIDV